MALFLNKELTFADGIFHKGTEVFPEREAKEIQDLKMSFSTHWADQHVKNFIPARIGTSPKFRWVRRESVA